MSYRYDDTPNIGYHGTPLFTDDTVRTHLVKEVEELKEQNTKYQNKIKKLKEKIKKMEKHYDN